MDGDKDNNRPTPVTDHVGPLNDILASLKDGEVLLVTTLNRTYRVWNGPSHTFVQGHPEFCPEPRACCQVTFGMGRMWFDDIVTSPVRYYEVASSDNAKAA